MMARSTIAVFAAALLLAPALASASEGKYEVDENKVYYGDASSFEKPAAILISKVFDAIPEYVDARKKGKDDPQYYILLEKANQKFFTALERVAAAEKYDLIAEKGAVKSKECRVPDATESVIKALPN